MYDVAIIGSGPSGLFAARRLKKKNVVLIDVAGIDRKDILRGFGGAGTYSDGKIDLTHKVGGLVHEKIGMDRFTKYLEELEMVFSSYGVKINNVSESLEEKAKRFGLELVTYPLIHTGTDGVRRFVKDIYDDLKNSISIETDFDVEKIEKIDGGFSINGFSPLQKTTAKNVILAMGRVGSEQTGKILDGFGIRNKEEVDIFWTTKKEEIVDIGFRIDVPSEIMSEFTDILHDVKLKDENARTFCVCPEGEIVFEEYDGYKTTNGQSFSNKRTGRTNMAVLTSVKAGPRFAHDWARMVYDLAGDKFPELPKFVSVFPYDVHIRLKEFMLKIESLFPGIEACRLYGPEIKTYGAKYECDDSFMVMPGMYVVGDCSGYTRNIAHAAISGMVAADRIVDNSI